MYASRITVAFLSFLFLCAPLALVQAQWSNEECRNDDYVCFQQQQEGIINNPLKAKSLTELVAALMRGVARIGTIFLVLAFVWVGFNFAAAQGNEEKIRDTRRMFLWTVVGAAVLIGAELIANLISSTANSLAP